MTERGYVVMCADNFHYMDAGAHYKDSTHATAQTAIDRAKVIVDRSLAELLDGAQHGGSAEELLKAYKMFGDDPFILSPPGEPPVDFSAWNYAARRAHELCQSGSGELRRSPASNAPSLKQTLREIATVVIQHDSNRWWALKREIFDAGYQSDYVWEEPYRIDASTLLHRLTSGRRQILVQQWRDANPSRTDLNEEGVLSECTLKIVSEVIRRARIASSKTLEW